MKTIQTPMALRRDTRFQACSPGAKWVYGQICDRDEIPAEPGHDVLGTTATIVDGLGDEPRRVLEPLLLELAARALVTVTPDRLLVHPPQPLQEKVGPRGGKSGARRMAEYRDRQRARATDPSLVPVTVTGACDGDARHSPPDVTGDPSLSVGSDGLIRHTSPEVTEAAAGGLGVRHTLQEVTGYPSHSAKSDGSIRHSVPTVTESPVTEPVTPPVTVTDSSSRGPAAEGSGGSSPPSEVLSPHTPLSPNLSPPPPTEERGRGVQPALFGGETPEPTPSTRDLPEPTEGTFAAAALAAIRATVVLRTIVQTPVRLAVAVTNGAYPAVDVLREIRAADAWLVANPANKKKRGERFVANWLASAQERAPRVSVPASTPSASTAARPAPSPGPRDARVGIQPPAPRTAFDHVGLAKALGFKWPNLDPLKNPKDEVFQRLTGMTIEAARERVAAQQQRGATP